MKYRAELFTIALLSFKHPGTGAIGLAKILGLKALTFLAGKAYLLRQRSAAV
jgi:hypothetical protein